ncbi:unnamed protein product [Gongylonema pulchrum]|uniref:Uncharacterized protein n=1 Tax=Gongylonema pulchrum TaxID=637853 RepID=A0A3P6UMN6_9BILA|nr:unnamed protein product [Gongylonema pulchrum]
MDDVEKHYMSLVPRAVPITSNLAMVMLRRLQV